MLGHLLTLETEPLATAALSFVADDVIDPKGILKGKASTEEWLRNMGAESPQAVSPALERALAAHAFGAVTGVVPVTSPEQVSKSVDALVTPEAVQAAHAMLSAYEADFVERAGQIRNYVVAGLIEETRGKKAENRLKAFKLLGEITEVALFTKQVAVKSRKDMTDEELRDAIDKHLEKLTVNVDAVEVVDVPSVSTARAQSDKAAPKQQRYGDERVDD